MVEHNIYIIQIGIISHPWPRDTGEYAAQGPNIMSPEAPRMPPEACRAELEGRGRHPGGRGRHNVARGRHILQWHEAKGVILTLSYRQGDIGFQYCQCPGLGRHIDQCPGLGRHIDQYPGLGRHIDQYAGLGRDIDSTEIQYPHPVVLFYPGKYANQLLLSNVRPPI